MRTALSDSDIARRGDASRSATEHGMAPHAMPRQALPRRAAAWDAPPLHAALDYRARRLCIALDARGDGAADTALLDRLEPASARLLHWWCSSAACRMRVDNFNAVQRQALLHLLIAHEALRSDDPGLLYRLACDPRPSAAGNRIDGAAHHHRLRLAAGSGLRWVLQALIVWRWANAIEPARTRAGADATPTPRLTLIAATPDLARRLRVALLGDAASDASQHRIEDSSFLRHARLFLPPTLRTAFRAWLQAQADGDGTLRIVGARDMTPDAAPAPFCLIAAHGAGTSPLRIDLQLAADAPTHAFEDAALAEVPLAQAIRRGACKLPALEVVDTAGLPLRSKPPRRTALRPRLSRAHHRLLAAGLAALRRREAAFIALDPARCPRMAVLCAAPLAMRAARRWLIDAGIDDNAIAFAGDAPAGDTWRVIIATADAGVCDPRICVVAVLRSDRGESAGPLAAAAAVAGAALLWPEPDYADLRSENLERAALDRPPMHLIDVLSIVDDPRCRDEYARLPHAPGCMEDMRATDDLFAVPLREDAAAFDLILPAPCDEGPRVPPQRLSDVARRILRARHALPVVKSAYTHAPCSALDSGLRRALLECAEADPAIESHCLLDPRRHGADAREAWLAQSPPNATADTRGWPDAVLRTAERIYLVELLPFCPTGTHPPGPAERAMLRWLRQLDARPPEQRGYRRWYRATLPAPLFWSWKRSGGTLSALLAMLVDTAAHPGSYRRG